MPYSIPFSDPSKASIAITVNDLTENNTSTSLSLVGRNYSNYGVSVAKNFVHLLENFASPTSPNAPTEGQLWFDNANSKLMVHDSTGWRPSGGTHVKAGPTGPATAMLGDLWVDSQTQQLSLYNGQSWILVGPQALAGKKTGTYVEQMADAETGALHYVSVEYANDQVIRIIATETFIPQKKIVGFDIVCPGVNLTTQKFIGPLDTTIANTVAKFYGAATSADGLNVTSPTISRIVADNFARRDVSNIFLGGQSIVNDSGLTIGTTNNFSLTVNQGTALISNSADSSSIDVRITKSGVSNLLMKFDGKNRRVGINHPTPNVELDVNGSAYISGHLVAKGELDSTSTTTGSFQVAGGAGIAKTLYVGKNINAGGHLLVGEIDSLGNQTPGIAIAPRPTQNSVPIYDIGSSTNKFREVHAQRFVGDFTGAFTGNLSGTFTGPSTGFTTAVSIRIDDEITSNSQQFDAGGDVVVLTSAINQKAITNREEVLDNRIDDTLLIYRNNVGLRKVTRSSFLLGEAFTPIGAVLPYAGILAPLGYLFCDGSLVSRQEYPLLYQAIGNTYGSGTNPIYFRLPDMRGRFALGNTAMRNSLNNIVVSKTVSQLDPAYTGSTTVYLSNGTDGLAIGMSVSGTGINLATTIVAIPSSTQITLSQSFNIPDQTTLTFTYAVLSSTISAGDATRISNEGSNLNPSTVGGSGGASHITLDTTSGSNDANFSTGSAQTFGTTFDLTVTNPYLTMNYIIRAGVATTSI